MKSLLSQNRKRIKWTVFCPCSIPDEFLPLLSLLSSSVVEALHLFALTTENRSIQTGAQIIFMDMNG